MITPELMARLGSKLLGFRILELGAGEYRRKDVAIGNEYIVDISLIWAAEMTEYGIRGPASQRKWIVAVMKAQDSWEGDWRRGILLLPTGSSADREEYIGGDTLSPVDLNEDAVADLLKSIDLTSPNERRILDGSPFSCNLLVIGKKLSAEITINLAHSGVNHNLDKFRSEIAKVTKNILTLYDREDMNGFFEVGHKFTLF